MSKFLISLILFSAAADCASAELEASNSLCTELKDFANTQTGDKPISVVLTTYWGGYEYWKKCDSSRYKPGKKLCSYLQEHAHTEFPEDNLYNAAACLAKDTPKSYGNAILKLHHVTFSFINIEGVSEGIHVDLDFNDENGDTLTITARRHGSSE